MGTVLSHLDQRNLIFRQNPALPPDQRQSGQFGNLEIELGRVENGVPLEFEAYARPAWNALRVLAEGESDFQLRLQPGAEPPIHLVSRGKRLDETLKLAVEGRIRIRVELIRGRSAWMAAAWVDPAGEPFLETESGSLKQVVRTFRRPFSFPGAWLVVSQGHASGWRAWLNGAERELVPTNAVLTGMSLPRGKARIELRYRPPGLYLGSAVSLAGLLLIFLSAVHEYRGRCAA